MKLATPVAQLRGVGPKRAETLSAAGLTTVFDLLLITPGRYQALPALTEAPAATPCSVLATVLRVRRGRLRGRAGGFVDLRVSCGALEFNARLYGHGRVSDRVAAGSLLLLSGRLAECKAEFVASECTLLTDAEAAAEELRRLQPVRPKVEGLAAGTVDLLIEAALSQPLDDPLADWRPADMLSLHDAFAAVHQPSDRAAAARGAARLLFDRFVALLVSLGAPETGSSAPAIGVADKVRERIAARLPFALTPAQQSVVAEILEDMGCEKPMRRVLQGDVGSGKTAVAVAAALATVAARRQVLFLAPTQELAEQHHALLTRWLTGSRVRLQLVTSATKRNASDTTQVDILTGTHAALAQNVKLPRLALVVVDEQHRFGVRNRLNAVRKGEGVHALSISATPIPRTLALSLLGSLPRSVLAGMPPGRAGITTQIADTRAAIAAVRAAVARGERAFCVFPGIDAEGAPALLRDGLKFTGPRGVFAGIAHVLAHGRMPPQQRQSALAAFRSGKASLLLATVVVEVGLDVPEATLMVIFGAERHGLATLHQLRGRVGRGAAPGLCLLVPGAKAPEAALARLQTLVSESDGFRLAEADLALRGPGEVLGVKQAGHGAMLQVAAATEEDLLEQARVCARAVLASGHGPALSYCAALQGCMAMPFRPQDAI